jgi:hypothetical protein
MFINNNNYINMFEKICGFCLFCIMISETNLDGCRLNPYNDTFSQNKPLDARILKLHNMYFTKNATTYDPYDSNIFSIL